MTPSDQRYEPSSREPLFILAMDQRSSFAKLFGLEENADEAGLAKMRDGKLMIYEGFHKAAASGFEVGRAGVLVDEHLGSEVAMRAKADGHVLAMPVEKSGTTLFELEYGKDYPEHLAAYDPDFFKVLVRYNPADEAADRTTQIQRLEEVSAWAAKTGWRWLFELLVPPTREQLAQNEDQFHFDRQARPGLTAEAISAFSKGGVHPTVWKLEGYETTEGAEEVLRAVAAQADGPSECIVLGRNALMEQVEHWLSVAAPLPGYAGFAVGRSIWMAALQDLLAGRIDRDDAVATIASRYRTLVDAYSAARRPGSGSGDSTEPFTWQHPRLTPDREARIRGALAGADMRGTRVPAWMAATLLAEVDALRAEKGDGSAGLR
jgi:myo-inositol catabolism protein IolC